MLVKPFSFLGNGYVEPYLRIGQYYQGGYIVFLQNDYPNQTGLIASPIIVSSSVSWPTGQATSTNATYGQGYTITENAYNGGSTTGAIGGCWNYTNDGYTDWFLPNNGEIIYVLQNQSVLPYYGFTGSFHSSTAWVTNPAAQSYWYSAAGSQNTGFKTDLRDVIACRYITPV